jgi:hypothetical protein
MRLFTFEPGDGFSYRVLFGRMPGRGLVPHYTVFGIAEGSSDPGMWYAFDTDRVDEDIFYNHINPWATLSKQTFWIAWRLWLALNGQEDDVHAAGHLDDWRDDWRQQLPTEEL